MAVASPCNLERHATRLVPHGGLLYNCFVLTGLGGWERSDNRSCCYAVFRTRRNFDRRAFTSQEPRYYKCARQKGTSGADIGRVLENFYRPVDFVAAYTRDLLAIYTRVPMFTSILARDKFH